MAESLHVLIEEAEFKESFRGYDRNQVDDLLEQIGARVASLEAESARTAEMVRGAEDRARAEAEAQIDQRVHDELASRPSSASAPSEEEAAERLRRTLVLAQRTADAAIDEAREEAQALLDRARQDAEELTGTASSEADELSSQARQDAERLTAEAREEAERVRSEADDATQRLTVEAREEAERVRSEAREEAERVTTEARGEAQRMNEEAVATLAEETTRLEATRKSLTVDIALLEHHVEEQRLRLRESVTSLQRLLDEPGAFEVSPLGDPVLELHADDDAEEANAGGVDATDRGGDVDDKMLVNAGDDDTMLVSTGGDVLTAALGVEDTVDHGTPDMVRGDFAQDNGHEFATAPTQAAVTEPVDEEDGFLLELRKAMTDEQASTADDDRPQERSGQARKSGGQHPQGNAKQARVSQGRPQKFGRRR